MSMPQRTTKLDPVFERPASPRTVDFSATAEVFLARDKKGLMRNVNRAGYPMDRGLTTESITHSEPFKGSPAVGLVATSVQQRARARRRMKKGERLQEEAWEQLYKPLEEWDMEELARGRPRNASGDFRGAPPKFITRELHERAMERFKTLVRDEMSVHSIKALQTIQYVLENEEVDDKGKPIVTSSSKLDAAKFLIEHIVGKAVQPTTSDISVKLQGILGAVMVNPQEVQGMGYVPAHMGTRMIEGTIIEDDYEDYEDEING